MKDSPDGNYPNNAYSVLMTNGFFDLSAATFPVLTFWHKYYMEYRDYIYVEISTDGGITWTNELPTTGNRQYQSTWTQVMVDLSDYKASSVMVRFRLRETDSYVHDGWAIDNVELREWDDVSALPYPFFDDFENGLDNWEVCALNGSHWGLTETDSRSATHSVTDSPDGNYPNNVSNIAYC